MLTEICADLRNWFTKDADKHFGDFEISGGNIAPSDFIKEGQYFRIIGSTFNDGVHLFPAYDLTDEAFNGAVWAMAVPPAVVALTAEIEQYCETDGKPSVIISESFGGYSRTMATGKNGAPLTWKEQFSDRLNEWRKIR